MKDDRANACRRRAAAASLALALAVTPPRTAAAQPSAALTVQVAGTAVEARACPAARCPLARFALPRAGARIEQVSLGGRPLALVSIGAEEQAARYVLLLGAGDDGKVVELLRGEVDAPRGEAGERRTKVLLRGAGPHGESFAIGTRYENASACGRPVTMNVRWLDPATLEWHPGATIGLTEAERRAAVPLFARRMPSAFDPTLPRLLNATAASSAAGASASAITDGQLSTGWAEGRLGPGQGELVVMSSSPDVPIEGFQIVIRPTGGAAPASPAAGAADGSAAAPATPPDAPGNDAGAAPRGFFLATDDAVFAVTLPEDAWQQEPGTGYEVLLPAPVRSGCVALLLDTAYGRPATEQVTVAEIRARTPYDSLGPALGPLVDRLDVAGDEADAAMALLARGGEAAVAATIAAYERLSEPGRALALDVIDSGSCRQTAAFFVDRVVGAGMPPAWEPADDPAWARARAALRRCRADAVEALVTTLVRLPVGKARGRAAEELAAVSPRRAVPALAALLAEGPVELRRQVRQALGAAAEDARARIEVERLFEPGAFAERSPVARLDLLRAAAPVLASLRGGAEAFATVAGADRSFRARYLLQQPAGALALAGEPTAVAFLARSIGADESAHVRAAATRAGGVVPALAGLLVGALADPSPRVRQAALEAIGDRSGAPAAAAAQARVRPLLLGDRWTFVRTAAAAALGAGRTEEAGDEALVGALEDQSPLVRAAALRALGSRGSQRAADRVHAVADDPREQLEVRVVAVGTLGQLCRRDAVDLLTKLALRAGLAQLPYDRPLGTAALAALGAIHPDDLATRLAPLLARDRRIPAHVRLIARDVTERPGSCR